MAEADATPAADGATEDDKLDVHGVEVRDLDVKARQMRLRGGAGRALGGALRSIGSVFRSQDLQRLNQDDLLQ